MAPDWAAWRTPDQDDPNAVGGGKQFTGSVQIHGVINSPEDVCG